MTRCSSSLRRLIHYWLWAMQNGKLLWKANCSFCLPEHLASWVFGISGVSRIISKWKCVLLWRCFLCKKVIILITNKTSTYCNQIHRISTMAKCRLQLSIYNKRWKIFFLFGMLCSIKEFLEQSIIIIIIFKFRTSFSVIPKSLARRQHYQWVVCNFRHWKS